MYERDRADIEKVVDLIQTLRSIEDNRLRAIRVIVERGSFKQGAVKIQRCTKRRLWFGSTWSDGAEMERLMPNQDWTEAGKRWERILDEAMKLAAGPDPRPDRYVAATRPIGAGGGELALVPKSEESAGQILGRAYLSYDRRQE